MSCKMCCLHNIDLLVENGMGAHCIISIKHHHACCLQLLAAEMRLTPLPSV